MRKSTLSDSEEEDNEDDTDERTELITHHNSSPISEANSDSLPPITLIAAFKETGELSGAISLSLLIRFLDTFINMNIMGAIDSKNLAATALIASSSEVILIPLSLSLYPVASIAAEHVAKRNYDQIGPAMAGGACASILVIIPSLAFLLPIREILNELGQEKDLTNIVQSYFDAADFGLVPYFLLAGQIQLAFALEDTWSPNIVRLSNLALTNILGYMLTRTDLITSAMGAPGEGYAFSISQIFNLICFNLYLKFRPKFKEFELYTFRNWQLVKENFIEILKMGLPLGIEMGAELLGWWVDSLIIGAYVGKKALEAHTIVVQYSILAASPTFGAYEASSILVAGAVGSNRYADAFRLGNASIVFGAIFSFIPSIILTCIPREAASLFLSPDNPQEHEEIIQLTQTLFLINIPIQFLDAIRLISAGSLQGAVKDTTYAMITGILCLEVAGLSLGYTFAVPGNMGAPGVYLGKCAGLILSSIALSHRWLNKGSQLSGSNEPLPGSQTAPQIIQEHSGDAPEKSDVQESNAGLLFSFDSKFSSKHNAKAHSSIVDDHSYVMGDQKKRENKKCWSCVTM
jgi:MATE family multidrug resistance protein